MAETASDGTSCTLGGQESRCEERTMFDERERGWHDAGFCDSTYNPWDDDSTEGIEWLLGYWLRKLTDAERAKLSQETEKQANDSALERD